MVGLYEHVLPALTGSSQYVGHVNVPSDPIGDYVDIIMTVVEPILLVGCVAT